MVIEGAAVDHAASGRQIGMGIMGKRVQANFMSGRATVRAYAAVCIRSAPARPGLQRFAWA